MKKYIFLVGVQFAVGVFLCATSYKMQTISEAVHYCVGLVFCWCAAGNLGKFMAKRE